MESESKIFEVHTQVSSLQRARLDLFNIKYEAHRQDTEQANELIWDGAETVFSRSSRRIIYGGYSQARLLPVE